MPFRPPFRPITLLGAFLAAATILACGGGSELGSVGSLLDVVPRGADSFVSARVEDLRGEGLDDLVDELAEMVDADRLEDWEIDFDDITSLVISEPGGRDSLTVLRGFLSIEDIKEALDDDGFRDDKFQETDIWTKRRGDVALAFLAMDVVVIGDEKSVERSIDVTRRGGQWVQDDEEFKDILDTLERAPVYTVSDDCEFRGCKKISSGIVLEARDWMGVAVFSFRDQGSASDAERDVERFMDGLLDDLYLSEDGSLIVVTGEVDEMWLTLDRKGLVFGSGGRKSRMARASPQEPRAAAVPQATFAPAFFPTSEPSPAPVFVHTPTPVVVRQARGPTPTPTSQPAALVPAAKETIVFSDLNWSTAQVQNRIAQYVVEKGYGYPTDLLPGSSSTLLDDLIKGNTHVTMEIWFPSQLKRVVESGAVVPMGDSLVGEWQSTFVIPAYVAEAHPDLKTPQDLKKPEYQKLFSTTDTRGKAKLVGCLTGWSCALINDAQIEAYGLAEHVHIVRPDSQAVMFAEIFGAYENQEPWLGYMWSTGEPALKLELVRLQEPTYTTECWNSNKACAFQGSLVLIAVHGDLVSRAPEVIAFLHKWEFTIDSYRGIFQWMDANGGSTPAEAAVQWLESNEDTWTSWVTRGAEVKIKAALAAGERAEGWPGN